MYEYALKPKWVSSFLLLFFVLGMAVLKTCPTPFCRVIKLRVRQVILKVESSNPAHGEVYSIQHYVIKFVSGVKHHNPNPLTRISDTDSAQWKQARNIGIWLQKILLFKLHFCISTNKSVYGWWPVADKR